MKRWVDEDRGDSVSFSDGSKEVLLRYRWPGNIRELENLVERYLVLKAGEEVAREDLPEKVLSGVPIPDTPPLTETPGPIVPVTPGIEIPLNGDGLDLPRILLDLEKELIEKALDRFGGNKTRASEYLGINRTTLIEKLKRFGSRAEVEE